MSVEERWFLVPAIETDTERPDRKPPVKHRKYAEKAEDWDANQVPDSDKQLVLFRAESEILSEIAEHEDAEPISEIEARKIAQEIEEQQESEDPRPVDPGEGNTPEERLNDVISSLDIRVGDDGVTVADPVIAVGYRLFLDDPPVLLDFKEITELARQLFDLILCPPATVIPIEQREFIAFMSNFIQFAVTESNVLDTYMKDDLASGPGIKDLLLNYNLMVDHILLYDNLSDADQRVRNFIYAYTGISGPKTGIIPFGLFGPTSLAMLDGLVKYRCPDIDLSEGDYMRGAIEMPWRPNSPSNSSMNYHNRLQYWREYVASDEIKPTLNTIDDLTRYNENNLRRLSGVMGNEDILEREKDSTEHFLAVLSEQRNYTIHGQGNSRILAPLALNLCNLVLLDMIGSQNYDQLREDFLVAQRQS